MLVGTSSCAAPRRSPAGQSAIGQPAKPRPADLPAQATVHFDRLGPLPDLPEPTELIDRRIPPEALKRYLAGLALTEDYLDADAIPEFEAAIAADPAAFEPRLSLGRAALRAGDLPKAQAALEAAGKQRPRSSEIHYLLGLVAAAKDEGPVALRQLRYALALAGDDSQRIRVYFHLAQVLERQDYCLAAVEIAQRFEALARTDVANLPMRPQWRDLVASQGWRIPALRGACLRRLGKASEAVEAYDTSLTMSPGRAEVMLPLAESLMDAGDTRRAADVANKVASREPGNTTALAMLAATLAVDNRQAELRERLLALVRQNPSDLLLAQRVASIFLKFGQLDPALQALLIARKGISEPTPVYASLLQIVLANDTLQPAVDGLAGLLEQMEPGEQNELLEPIDLLQVSPNLVRDISFRGQVVLAETDMNGSKLLALGVIAGAADQPVLAEKALRAALRAQPDSLLIAVTLGEQILAQCRWRDAIAFASPLTDKFKDSGAIYRILGAAYDGLDDYKPAMANLYEALRRDKKDTAAMWLAGQINDRLGQSQPASSIYQVLVTIKPDAWPAHVALVKDLLALRQKDAALEHAKRLKEAFPATAVADLCLLMAQAGDTVPPTEKIAVLLKQHPQDPILLQALGESYLAEGDADQATLVFVGVLTDDPTNEDARLLLTTSLTRQLHTDLAMQVLQSLLAEHPNRILWRFAQAELFAQMGQAGPAADIMFDLLKTTWGKEQKHTLQSRLVFFLQYAGQSQRAIDLLQEELKTSPDERAVQVLLLGILENQNRRPEVLDLLRSWRASAAGDPLLRRLELQFLRTLGQYDAAAAEALSDWPAGKGPSGKDLPAKEAGRLAARDPDLMLLAAALAPSQVPDWLASRSWLGPVDLTVNSLAELAADAGDSVEAIELSRLASQDDEALARRAQWSFLAGDRPQAELVLLPQIHGKNADLYNRLARLLATFYKRMGLSELSLRQTEAMYQRNKDSEKAVEYANDLAYVYAERGQDLAQAEQLANLAVAGDPNSAAYMDTLAWVYYQQGRFGEALQWVQQAVRVPGQGEDPVLQEHLGDALWRAGRQAEAMQRWRKAAGLYAEELKTDRLRPDLRQGLQGVTDKIKAVESRKKPAIAPWAGQPRRTSR